MEEDAKVFGPTVCVDLAASRLVNSVFHRSSGA